MMYRYYQFLFFLLVFAALAFSGCTSVRLADTHNITMTVNDYNAWVDQQKVFDQQVHKSINQIGGHISIYNTEIAKQHPDVATLRANIAADQQSLQEWDASRTELDGATDRFASKSATLDFSGSPDTKQAVLNLSQEMRIYTLTMKNAQQHLVEYTNYMNSYLLTDDPDYWNDAFRISAMKANQDGVSTISDGDKTLADIAATAKKLENSQ